MKMYNFLKSLLPKKIKYFLVGARENFYSYTKRLNALYSQESFSQEGEDRILYRIFETKEKGFYVDVGAHHPYRFSNTYIFYKKGWTGINIDAMPGSMKLFEKFRPNDINIETVISNSSEHVVYYIFNESALNTFDENLANRIIEEGKYTLVKKVALKPVTLTEVLDKYLSGRDIDFLNIDVEQYDFNVLSSLDLKKYRPEVILIEELLCTLEDILEKSEIANYLHAYGYKLFAKTVNTLFFRVEK